MWFSVFPVLLACKNLSLKDFCFWQGAQNRRVCMKPISHCTLCLSFTSNSLGRLTGQMQTCKNDWCYFSWFWAKYFLSFPWRNFLHMSDDGQDVTYAHCPLPLFLVEHKLAWYVFYLLSCAWGISPGVRKSRLFALAWTLSKGLGATVWKICHSASEDHCSFLKSFSLIESCHELPLVSRADPQHTVGTVSRSFLGRELSPCNLRQQRPSKAELQWTDMENEKKSMQIIQRWTVIRPMLLLNLVASPVCVLEIMFTKKISWVEVTSSVFRTWASCNCHQNTLLFLRNHFA